LSIRRLAVRIGGKSEAHDLSPERAALRRVNIESAVLGSGGSIMATFSRCARGPHARRILSARLSHLPGVIWDGEGENPYFAFLAASDAILVTEDSANMATEASATGKPVFVAKMDGGSLKFRLFHQDLQERGAARPFEGSLHAWSYAPLVETERAASEVLKRGAHIWARHRGDS